MSDEVLTERHGRVLVITLNRPDQMNSINTALAQGLVAAINELDGSADLSLGVLTGAGRGFSAGMDLKAFATEGMPQGFQHYIERGSQKPMIAAIEGFCLAGGLEMALVCDLLVSADNVRFGIPEVGVGLFAGGGALMRLPRRIPYGVAMEMALTGDPISAAKALELGLVSRLTEKGGALAGALELAERIAKNAPLSLQASKAVLRDMAGLTDEEFWKMQGSYMKSVFTSNDAKEGPRAFAEKRPPVWSGS